MPISDIAEQKARKELDKGNIKSAVTILMKAYGDEIFAISYTWTKSKDDADDLNQITFIKAFQKLESFKGNSSFRTWLYTIARNNFLDWLKKKSPDTSEIPDPGGTDTSFVDALTNQKIRHCMKELKTNTQNALHLRMISEYNYQEISQILIEKERTLQARVARAIPLLRKCLEKHGVIL